MEIPIDYHIIFMMMAFIIFLVTVLLLFIDTTFEKAIAANILAIFNMIICIVCAMSFHAIDMYGHDSTGTIQHNLYAEMYPFSFIYVGLFWIMFMLMFYSVYLFYKKPWEEYEKSGFDEIGY